MANLLHIVLERRDRLTADDAATVERLTGRPIPVAAGVDMVREGQIRRTVPT